MEACKAFDTDDITLSFMEAQWRTGGYWGTKEGMQEWVHPKMKEWEGVVQDLVWVD